MKKTIAAAAAVAMTIGVSLLSTTAIVQAQEQAKPNILVIMGDDVGYWNISAYNRGMMGYHTPNIDRIANEGAILPTTTASSPAPPAVPRSSLDRALCAPDF